ncbi:MAG: radical SAM protein [Firmicutes bacterium]|nr:radical SAM protein [Bacillota bacterium]
MPERLLNIGADSQFSSTRWRASRYNLIRHGHDDTMLIYNTYSGALGGVLPENEELVRTAFKQGYDGEVTPVIQELIDAGFLIREGTNEMARVRALRQKADDPRLFHLILMSSEDCNFRCVYCYESFPRDRMEPWVQDAIIRLVESRAKGLDQLVISWFGGEPLKAADIMLDVMDRVRLVADPYGIAVSANATTNGYYLTPELTQELVSRGVRTFTVTVDGLADVHDTHRVGRNGEKTFDIIMGNLQALQRTDIPFKINLRCNFDQETDIERFVAYVANHFAGDDRFHLFFRPVGKWGGPNDDDLAVCTGRDATQTMISADLQAVKAGVRLAVEAEFMQPLGTVCYAAKSNSFLIGADGTVYKCTVALESDFNKIGTITQDGWLDLDQDKLLLWTDHHGEDDKTCTSCFFRPSCHGSSCPLIRIESGRRPCPKEKDGVSQMIPLLWEAATKFPGSLEEPTVLGSMD